MLGTTISNQTITMKPLTDRMNIYRSLVYFVAGISILLASGIPALSQTRIYETNVWVETVAGSAVSGYVDGRAEQARFMTIKSIVADEVGNAFVLDVSEGGRGYSLIRKISADGHVTTLAGKLPRTFPLVGDAASGLLKVRSNLALSQNGTLYFWNDPLIWLLPSAFPAGLVQLRSNGAMSLIFQNILSPAAMIDWLQVDRDENILFKNCALQKINPNGNVSKYAGGLLATNVGGWGVSCQVSGGLKIDTDGNVVFCGLFGDIQKASPDGIVTNITGLFPGSTINDGPYSLLGVVRNLEVDRAGNIFYGYYGYGGASVRKISPAGFVTTVAGGPIGYADGAGRDARFGPNLLVAFGRPNELYVSEETRIRRVVFDPDSSSPIPIEELTGVPRLTIEKIEKRPVDLLIQIHGKMGRTYRLEVSDTLLGQWRSVGEARADYASGGSGVVAFQAFAAGKNVRFYRAVLLPGSVSGMTVPTDW